MKLKFFLLVIAFTVGQAQPVLASERLVDAASSIEFVRIPAGCFPMGAEAPGTPRDGLPLRAPALDEVPRHEVCVDEFWLARSEVTRQQWRRVTQQVLPGADRPVADVSWHDAVKFAEQMTAKGNGRFRLPTEAEWEYACHAGVFLPVSQPLGEERLQRLEETARFAWYRYQANRDPEAYPVMTKNANAWGAYDMLGNLWEWTADGYDEKAYATHAKNNPTSPLTDERRVLRGGSFKSDLALVRCGSRNYAPAEERSRLIGFRIVREVDRSSDPSTTKR